MKYSSDHSEIYLIRLQIKIYIDLCTSGLTKSQKIKSSPEVKTYVIRSEILLRIDLYTVRSFSTSGCRDITTSGFAKTTDLTKNMLVRLSMKISTKLGTSGSGLTGSLHKKLVLSAFVHYYRSEISFKSIQSQYNLFQVIEPIGS